MRVLLPLGHPALIKVYLPSAAVNPSALGDILRILDEVNFKNPKP